MIVLGVLTSKIRSSDADLCSYLEADYFGPDLESTRTFPAVLCRPEPMPARAEVLANWSEGGEEALGMAWKFEAAQHPEGTRVRVGELVDVNSRSGC